MTHTHISHVVQTASQCHTASEQTAESQPAGTAQTPARSLSCSSKINTRLPAQSLSLLLSVSLGVTVCHFTFPSNSVPVQTRVVLAETLHTAHSRRSPMSLHEPELLHLSELTSECSLKCQPCCKTLCFRLMTLLLHLFLTVLWCHPKDELRPSKVCH